jgi:hypothetical protein
MQVLVIFDPAFDSPAGEAVRIVDTPANQSRFARRKGLDEGGAIFSPDRHDGPDRVVVHRIRDAQLHHPDWRTIEVIGTPLSASIAATLRDDGRVTSTPVGFRLDRA